MTAALENSPTRSFPRLNIDPSEALLSWLVDLIEAAPQDQLRDIQNKILIIEGSAEKPTVTFSKKTDPKIHIQDGRLFFEFGSQEIVIKEGLGPVLSLLSTEEREQLTQAIVRANRAKAIKGE